MSVTESIMRSKSRNSNRKRQALRTLQNNLERLEKRLLLAAEISEIMADNETTLRDEDGDYSDWIELRNTTGATIGLGGMYLTNDTNDLDLWELPAGLSLDDGEHIVIFASGKDRDSGQLHTNFQLDEAGGTVALVNANGNDIESQMALEGQLLSRSAASADGREGIRAFFDKRKPDVE